MDGLKDSVHYSRSFKMGVIQEVLSGQISKEEARRLYGIKGNCTVLKWMRKAGLAEPAQNDDICIKMKSDNSKHSTESEEQLSQRIKELEKRLEVAELEAEAYSKMIDIAEREFKISIRKKSDTKQSNE